MPKENAKQDEIAVEGAAPPSPGAVAKKLRSKKAAEAASAKPAEAKAERKSIALERGVKAPKPSDPSELYAGHSFERLMMSMVWPLRLSRVKDARYRHWGHEGQENPPAFMESAAAWVGAGREESLSLGATPEVVERLKEDEELCEAVCKIALFGCKELGAFIEGSRREERGRYDQMDPRGSAGVALVASGIFEALKADGARPSGVREALIELAGAEREWEGVGAKGLMGAGAEEVKLAKRGGAARAALTRMGLWRQNSRNSPSQLYWAAMSTRSWGVRSNVGSLSEEGELKGYLRELEGYERALPVFFAEALKTVQRDPKLLAAFEKMCSERCSLGFESVRPGDGAAEILPELEELSRLKRAASGASERRKQEKELERGLAGEGAAGQLAFAAAKAYGLEAPTPQALVGEAKRALQERAGLSAASWKMALSSPAALSALVAGLEQSAKLARNAEALEDRRESLKKSRAEEAKRISEQGERLVRARFDAAGRKAAESLGASAAARALSLGLAQGIAPESIERAVRLSLKIAGGDVYGSRGSARFALHALAGRLPYANFTRIETPDAARLTLSDIQATQKQGPAWVKIICEQFDKRVKKGLAKAGFASEQEAAAAKAQAPGEPLPPGLPEGLAEDLRASSVSKKPKAMTALELIEQGAMSSMREDLDLLCDYLRSMEGGFFSNLPDKFGWGTLMRQQEIWHEDQTRRRYESDPSSGRVWEAALGAIEAGDFKAVELVNGRQLIEEGEQMRHCVASYTSRCLDGSSRIFSIRRHGARVATLELGPRSANGGEAQWREQGQGVASWAIAQNKGRHNAAVADPETLAFCNEVKRRANEALAKLKEQAKAKPGQAKPAA